MEMTNIYIYGTIGALLFLVIGALLGYARCESQVAAEHAAMCQRIADSNILQAELLNDAKNKAAVYENRWKFADKYREALVQALTTHGLWNFANHGDNPHTMLTLFMIHVEKLTLDPSVSQKAKNLHTAGVRKGAKKGRAQMQKLMQKSIDTQAETINSLDRRLFEVNGKRQTFVQAVHNVLDDKIALVGVRKSIKQAIGVEVERLRDISVKKGA